MKIPPAAAIVPILIVLLTWLSLRAINPQAELFDVALGELDRFAMIENALYRDVFSARAGTLRNYDPIVREVDMLRDSLDRLRQTAAIDGETATAVDRLSASIDRQEELVEQFKSDNALLHNSLSFFGRFSVRPVQPAFGPAISAAAAAMLHLTLDTSPTVAREVQGGLDELDQQARSSGDGDSVAALLAHGRLLHDLLPAVDQTLRTMRALPRRQQQHALRTMILKRQVASRRSARQYRRLLYGTSLLLVGFLVFLGLRLRARATALRRRAAFEHVIASVSMRFITAQPQNLDAEIQHALAAMAGCIGSDRAYFLLSGPVPRSHVWCRAGIGFSPGWPEGAPLLAARLGHAGDGIIHVPRVSRMPPGENKDACIAVGIGGCAFAANVDENGTGFLLGFEALGRPCRITADGELSLLRMALDTIVYAVERHAMERERARLQTRLQQAHRMETVGNLTSGIAHNFNNILGGILGHSEVIEQHLGPDTGPLRNLDAIRRGAERARDLVDQILTFGRHRDARRTPLRASALLAEAGSLLNVSLPSGIDLVIHEPPPAAIISGEPAQLQQVILNLCNNAAHAMEDGGRIEVDTDVHDIAAARSLSHDEIQPGRYVCIAVTDTGCGMDEATLTRIFEAFFTTRSSGNGLGLATVREIVREHGGAINVASTPGGGSRFEVWLPRAAADAAMPEANGSMFPLGRGDTVLMAASDGRRLLRDEEMLAALGYEPVGFSDPEAALAALRARPHRFDALIVGYLGSVTSSLGFAAALHAVAPSLPIVLATKAIEKIGTASLMSAGITDVVHWPIIAAEIAATLHHCLAPARLDTTAPHSSERGVPSLVP